jgi:NAD-dependent deacetylase
MESLDRQIDQVAELVAKSEKIIFFTGAGVSTESGIPDFRGPDGIWNKIEDHNDLYIDRFLSDSNVRKMHWEFFTRGDLNVTQYQPNPAHYAIAELEKMGKLYGVVTQNVDGLHQKAGVSENMLFQLHGDGSHATCLSCTTRYAMEEIIEWMAKDKDIDEPKCAACKGILKPEVVFFGEQLPWGVLMESEKRSRSCDLCIVVGSTLIVHPAAMIPQYAQQGGAKLVIINIGPTEMDRQADIRIDAKAGEVTPRILQRAKEIMGVG